MSINAVDATQTLYAAFGRGDVPTILAMLAPEFEWSFKGSSGLPYTRTCRTQAEVASWFGDVAAVDDIQAFEPREFIGSGNSVTVLGFERTVARPSGKVFECDWVHVFSYENGQLKRFWGMYDTEASARAR